MSQTDQWKQRNQPMTSIKSEGSMESNGFNANKQNPSTSTDEESPAVRYSPSGLSGYASSYGSTWSESDDGRALISSTVTALDDDELSDKTPVVSNHYLSENKSVTLTPPPPPKMSPKGSTKSTPQNSDDDLEARYRAPLPSSPFHTPTRKPESAKRALRRQICVSEQIEQERGVKQIASCRDMVYALSFIVQLIVVVFLVMSYGPDAFSKFSGKDSMTSFQNQAGIHFAYGNVLIITWCCGAIAIVVSVLCFIFMSVYTRLLIPVGLCLSITVPLIWSIIGLVDSPQNFESVIGLFIFAIAVAHCFIVWDKIPVATANLYTSLFAARKSRSILVLAIVVQVVALTWIILYFLLCIGLYDLFLDNENIPQFWKILSYLCLGISFFWTIQTLLNVLQASIAGFIYTWWFAPSLSSSQCLEAVGNSIINSGIFSLGSVCFGSLLVAPINVLFRIADHIRPNREETAIPAFIMAHEYVVSAIDYLHSRYHEFAFVYIGIYGYNFHDAAMKSNELFQKRGWTSKVTTNDLISNLLLVFSLGIGCLCGFFAVVISSTEKKPLVSLERPKLIAFVIGFFVGVTSSNILFSVITSAVNTVVVCFAGNPVELQRNHPECSMLMRTAWRESFPTVVDFVETKEIQKSGSHSIMSPSRPNRKSLDSLFI
jgi:hypothetical protein